MPDQTIPLSYEERGSLLTILNVARQEITSRYPEHLAALDVLMRRVSSLECQPGGCPYCNADAAREYAEQEYADALEDSRDIRGRMGGEQRSPIDDRRSVLRPRPAAAFPTTQTN